MRMTWLLAALPLLVAPPAFAHGSSRIKVVEKVTLPAAPEAVWAVIGNFHDMSWDPAIAGTAGDGGNALQSFRTLTLKTGGMLEEDLERYDAAAMSYATFLPHNDPTVLPVTNFSTVLTVSPAEGGGSIVEWRAAAFRGYPNDNPPPNQNDEAAAKAMDAYLRAGLDGLSRRLGGGS
ncbi:MAG TPA: SRPBCC family protein [Aliidongia sp.]|nr:SRPBCC family protein [Aliidongia sp.]